MKKQYTFDPFFDNLSKEMKISVLNQNIVTADVQMFESRKNSKRYKALKSLLEDYQSQLKELLACNNS